jgi:hypothetical protein
VDSLSICVDPGFYVLKISLLFALVLPPVFFDSGGVKCSALLFGQAVEALRISVLLFSW